MKLKRTGAARDFNRAGLDAAKAAERATRANADALALTAKAYAHVITGRTRGSIRVEMDGPLSGHVLGEYGAFWEERRGGQHAFASRAIEHERPLAIRRLDQALEGALNGR